MTEIVKLQLKNGCSKGFIKLAAEIRAAGFKGSITMGPTWARPTLPQKPSHTRIVDRCGGWDIWLSSLAKRHETFIKEHWLASETFRHNSIVKPEHIADLFA
jgi:hypothetical protein